MKKRLMAGLLLAAVSALALVAAGCGGSSKSSSSTGGGTSAGVKALPAANCNPIQYKGAGDADYLIASDLPLIGSSRLQTVQMTQAIAYTLQQQDWKAGDYKIAYQSCNDAIGAARQMGPDEVQRQRARVRREQELARRDRDVQLRVRRDHHPGAEPGSGRRDAALLAGEHLRLPDRAVLGR